MRKFYLFGTLVLALISSVSWSQDFSNKGKEFWLAYSYHVGMINQAAGPPVMTLYITSNLATTYTVEIFGVTTLSSGTIGAGQVITVDIPSTYFINNEGLFTNKAIRVTSDKPVVVYSYITRSAASGATLCLPTAVLGREYVSMNYTQISNETNSNSFITIVAVEDNTAVEIVPSAATKNGWTAGTTHTVNLNKGDIYQVLGTTNAGNTGSDLTGTVVRSVASAAGGCKKIAVFSGSGKISIGCPTPSSSDNLYQQLYPTASWGKKYLTIPSYGRPNAIYRIARSTAAANVYLNGTLIPAASFINNYYEFSNNIPNKIESDQPICVAQYFSTQGCMGNGSPYDPDMIILNPVEQNIDKVTLVSSNLAAVGNRQHHLHVIIKNGATALSSFKLDGVPVPTASWTVHPADPSYSYIYLSNVAQGYHTLSSDTGFNALAYGYADFETYGYSAGSNIKDLYQYVTVDNEYASIDFPAACKNVPFYLSMTLPYEPTQITWQFNNLFPDVTINNPVYFDTKVVNGRTVYRYKITNPFTTAMAGVYPIKVIVQNPTADGCSGIQEINYDLQIFEPPIADFNFSTNGCLSSPVSFTDNSNSNGRTITHWHWNFDDGNTQNDVANTAHNYTTAGSFNVKYTIITDVGCKADTVIHAVVVNEPPVANFTVATPYCAGKTITFTDGSTSTGGATIVKWYWNFGDGSPVITALNNASQTHTYATTNTYNVTLQVETSSGCLSTVFSKPVIIHPNPVVDFSLPNVCLPAGSAQFNNLSTIADGTANLFAYSWDFGDGSPLVTAQSPLHNYSATGPYNVSLTVTSNNGCVSSLTKSLSTIYPEPVAGFMAPAEVCLGTAINFTDQSTAANSSVTQWNWDFGDGTSSTLKNPVKTYATPNTYTVKLSVTSAIGCQTVNNIATKTVVVNPLPSANFTTSLPGCAGEDITFTDGSAANAGNIVKWTWNYGDGNNTVLTNSNPFIHNYAAVNNYNATLQVETDKGCVSSVTSKNIAINTVPSAGFISPEVCLTDPVAPFIDTSSIEAGTISSWAWNFGDPNASAGNPNISSLQNPGHKYASTGSYTATLVVTSNQGCKDTIDQTFTVNGSVPVAGFTVQSPNALCSNTDIMITDGSTVDFGNIVKVEVYWDYANDPSIKTTDDYPSPGKTYSHRYPEFGSPATRSYTIQYVAYSGINCVSITTKTVTVLATPSLQFDVIDPVCANDPAFQITQAQLLNALPGSFAFTGTGVSSSGLFNPSAAGAGSHIIRYTYSGANGCSNYVDRAILVNPVPVVDAGPDRFLLEGGVTTLLGSASGNSPSFLWTPASYLSSSTIAQPTVTAPDDIYYTLLVTSADGCKASDEVFVKVLKTPVIPNIFSPNGDGVHDKWVIEYLESYPGCIVQIYNRYGQLVFRKVNYDTPWDGKINGQDAPVGTYYYIIDPKNGRKPLTGFVDIIR